MFVPHELVVRLRRDLTSADMRRIAMELRADIALMRGGLGRRT